MQAFGVSEKLLSKVGVSWLLAVLAAFAYNKRFWFRYLLAEMLLFVLLFTFLLLFIWVGGVGVCIYRGLVHFMACL